VLRAEPDDFHRPSHKFRSMGGEWTPELYLAEGYDFGLFRELLLAPLGPGGDLRCRVGVWDSYHDEPIPEEWVEVDRSAVAVIDGMLLLGPDLAAHFDFGIWLEVSPETVIARALARDVAWVGSAREVEARYRQLWLRLHALCEQTLVPKDRADVIIDHDEPEEPQLTWRTRERPD
jgi:uridine kinase